MCSAKFVSQPKPNIFHGIDRWIYGNAMHCIAWTADDINQHRDLIDEEELWHEFYMNASAGLPYDNTHVSGERSNIRAINDVDQPPHESISQSDE